MTRASPATIRALSVWLNHVDEGWDPSKVDDAIVFVNVNGGNVVRGGSGEGDDVGKKLISPDLHSVIKQGVALSRSSHHVVHSVCVTS